MNVFADREERDPNLPNAVEVAMCVVTRDHKQPLPIKELLDPRTVSLVKTFVEHAIEHLKPCHSIDSQILISPYTSPEQKSLQERHRLFSVRSVRGRPARFEPQHFGYAILASRL
jgi:hypothetical protein